MSLKMESTGGYMVGVTWDDGAHDNVKKIQISHHSCGISLVKFEYLDGTEIVTGEQYATEADTYLMGDEYRHGKISEHEHTTEEFELEPDEYITEVETYVVFITEVIGQVSMLIFKTNKRTSKAYGAEKYCADSRKKIVLGEKNKKIVGFHGNSGDNNLHALGVHVSPINEETFKQRAYKSLHQITNKFI